MDENLKQRLKFWKEKADHVTNDHWVRFIIYWMIFDAYITEKSRKDSDKEKFTWFYNNNNELKSAFQECWQDPNQISVLERLKELSPITDMRPSRRNNNLKHLNNIMEEAEVFNFIYQIRCNTFHGAKDLTNSRDQQLVRLSARFFKQPLSLFLAHEMDLLV